MARRSAWNAMDGGVRRLFVLTKRKLGGAGVFACLRVLWCLHASRAGSVSASSRSPPLHHQPQPKVVLFPSIPISPTTPFNPLFCSIPTCYELILAAGLHLRPFYHSPTPTAAPVKALRPDQRHRKLQHHAKLTAITLPSPPYILTRFH